MDTGHTDIARALRLAMASFPADRQKRIVLFSDGNQNMEDARARSAHCGGEGCGHRCGADAGAARGMR